MKKPLLTLIPQYQAITKSETHLDVVLRLQMPSLSKTKISKERKPIALSLVIDRSGSMHGEPIRNAKLAAISLIDKLKKGDSVSIVAYENVATIVAPLMEVTENRQKLKQLINTIQASGGTGLREGFLTGAKTLAPTVNDYGLSRILLISDGVATDGSQPDVLKQEAQSLAQAGITTSTYGLGSGFNETLMSAIAAGGSGLAFYAESAEVLIPYFDSEFDMLSGTLGQKAKTIFKASVDGQLVDISNLENLNKIEQDVFLGSLFEESERFIGFRLNLAQVKLNKDSEIQIQASVEWEDVESQKTLTVSATANPIVATKNKATKNDWAEERLKELEAVRIQQDALKAARHGDWASVTNLVGNISAMAGNNAYVKGIGERLSAMSLNANLGDFSKEVTYASSSMATRSVSLNEDVTKLDNDKFGMRKIIQSRAGNQGKQ